MHPADIICALSKAGYSQTKVAQDLNVSIPAVNQVIHGVTHSYNIASFISAATSIPLTRLWPDGRYNSPPRAAAPRAASERRAAA